MPHPVADMFHQAARANLDEPRRSGNLVTLDPDDEVLYSGDIHGHRENLARIIAWASLGSRPRMRLIVQELIHGPADAEGHDRSLTLLMRVARLKIAHPAQVLMLLANHDVAQVTGAEITKAGLGVCETFNAGVRASYGPDADEILAAANELLLSMPLAVRSPNGVWMSHSLPSPSRMAMAGLEILERPYAPADLKRGGPVYEWTWGRGHTPEQLESLARQLGVQFFLLAHRHTETGYETISDRGITVLSDNAHGHVVRFAAGEPFGLDQLPHCLHRIAALPTG